MGYRLRDDTYACVASGIVVVLDLAANRYMALPKPLGNAFFSALEQNQIPSADSSSFDALCSAGILVPTNEKGLKWTRPEVDAPQRSITEDRFPQVSGVELFQATWHRVVSVQTFHRRPLIKTIRQLRNRKLKCLECASGHQASLSVTRLAAYLDTRFLIPTQDKCLPWSIGFIDAFADQRSALTLVIGVRTDPFAAHAWVQKGDTVMTDDLDTVLPYTPILAV